MNALHSPIRSTPLAWHRARIQHRGKKHALLWTAGLVFASAALLALSFLAVIAIFDQGVASQLASPRAASMQLAPMPLAGPEMRDDFYQQKLDARADDLPAQF